MRFVGPARTAAFGSSFEEEQQGRPAYEALLAEHKAATGETRLARGGYPDMGVGRYSALLNYDKWYALANAQRVHVNFVEGVASAIALNVMSGLFYPRFAAAAGAVYVIGREVFAWGYTTGGADKRLYGALTYDLALLAMVGAALRGGWRQAGVMALLRK